MLPEHSSPALALLALIQVSIYFKKVSYTDRKKLCPEISSSYQHGNWSTFKNKSLRALCKPCKNCSAIVDTVDIINPTPSWFLLVSEREDIDRLSGVQKMLLFSTENWKPESSSQWGHFCSGDFENLSINLATLANYISSSVYTLWEMAFIPGVLNTVDSYTVCLKPVTTRCETICWITVCWIVYYDATQNTLA